MLTIDGSTGEGGGQVLRTSLALSLITGTPFRIERIRAARRRPGLMRQHLTAVQAAAAVGQAETDGARLGSGALAFRPAGVRPGDYRFDTGGAGSAMLVLQTILPALALAGEPSSLVLEGGTHNPLAPPFEFFAHCFLPLLERMGPRVSATIERPGFYPAGGGRVRVHVEPARSLRPLELIERGEIRRRLARALVANLPAHIARRELDTLRRRLGWARDELRAEQLREVRGPGNALLAEIESDHLTEVFTGFGERGVPAETVAERLARQVRDYVDAGVPVGPHLADQWMIPLALAGGGAFRTLPLTRHATTNAEIIRHFLELEIEVVAIGPGVSEVRLHRAV